jgi:2OG-Fe(II) oxygenase superfamily
MVENISTISGFQLNTKANCMYNLPTLSALVQPQHLDPNSLLSYQTDFETHPARLAILKNFLQEPVAARLSKFLRDEAEFGRVYGLYNRTVSEEEWLNAGEHERFFRFSKVAGISAQCRLSTNALTYLQFRKALQDAKFTAFYEGLSGAALRGSDTFAPHSMKQGDFLKIHNDNEKNRRLALVFYLSPGWESRFGGALIILDKKGDQIKIEAEYNSMVVFDVTAGTTHYIEQITSDAGDSSRLTISGWFLKRE